MPFPTTYARAVSLPQKSYSDHIRELHYRIDKAQERMARASKTDTSAHRITHRRRAPLSDGSSTANTCISNSESTQQHRVPMAIDNNIPKNESPAGNRTFAVQHGMTSPRNKRVSQVSNETPSDSKRNSAVSTTSTNASIPGRKRKTHIGPWHLGATVGKGGTARVRKVKHAVTGQVGVAKIIPVAMAERARAISLANLVHSAEKGDPTLHFEKAIPLGLEREIAIMKLLKHPNIVRLYDVWENRNEIYLIMEYVQGGELFEYVADRQRLQEDVTVYLFRQIIWALKYCHGLNIHHRDLKPENILLDYDTMTVKLVDFGMAALQPEGNFLTTPCGSPHYAAPELLRNLPYDGSQADVWSAGVVLFVMLTGYPPFNFPADPHGIAPEDHKLKGLFRAISRAEYRMPSVLGPEAQDLIRRIFVPDPSKRLTIDEVWDHPFIHKYDSIWGLDTLAPSDSMIALAMAQDSWKPLKPKYIDRDIFRALRTLWHSESDTALIDKLCSSDFNLEKFFYHTMLRYREDNIGNLQNSQSLGYSGSDYQHNRSAETAPPLPKDTASRTMSAASKRKSVKSEFSITGDEHLLSKHSYYDLPVSEASYDPFRASRSPIVAPKIDYTNVTVHRLSSKGSKKHATRTSRSNSLRVEVLRAHDRRASRISSKHSSGSNSARRGTTGKRSSRSSSSRLSLASSHLLSGSPLPVMRPSEVHKRGVQFSHIRRSSTGSALPSMADADISNHTPDHRARALRKLAPGRSNSHLAASPPTPVDPVVVRKKGAAGLPTPRTRKLKEHADVEARKVSAELGKVCDEAFWRSSVSSSFQTSSSVEKAFVDTPPSSISRPSPHTGMNDPFSISDSIRNRPLPPTPMVTRSTLHPNETPVTYTTRELAEMRDRLAVKYAREGAGNQKYFNDVLRQLDNLMIPNENRSSDPDSRRIVSAPPDYHCQQGSVESNGLDAIPEEGDQKGGRQRAKPAGHVVGGKRGLYGHDLNDGTIRVVTPSPPMTSASHPTQTHDFANPTPWAPLNIRKSSTSTKSSSNSGSNKMAQTPSPPRHNRNRGYTVRTNSSYPSLGLSTLLLSDDTITPATPEPDPLRLESHLVQLTSSHPARSTSLPDAGRRGSISGEYLAQEVQRMSSEQYAALTRTGDGNAMLSDIPEDDEATFSDGNLNANSGPNTSVLATGGTNIGRSYDLDDRPKTRDDREKEKNEPAKQSGFKSFFKGLSKKKVFSSKGKNPPADDKIIIPEDTSVFGDLTVHRTHDSQRDISAEMEIARFVTGFKKFVRNFGYWSFMTPLIHVIPLFVSRSAAWDALRIKATEAPGFCVVARNLQKYTTTIKCDASLIPKLSFDCTIDVEIFGISQRGNRVRQMSVVRIVQIAGPGRSFAAIAHEIQAFFENAKMVVTEELQAEEIKATLYKGLGESMPYMPRASFDI